MIDKGLIYGEQVQPTQQNNIITTQSWHSTENVKIRQTLWQ